MLCQLVYISSATLRFSEEDLDKLLVAARANNARNGVTGVLLYDDDAFLQLLEGTSADLERTLGRISRDPRHTGLTVVQNEPISERDFGSWDMAYQRVNKQDPRLAIAARRLDRDFIRDLVSHVSQPAARVFLDQFGQALR